MKAPYRASPDNYKPTHPSLFQVDFGTGSFASCLRAVKAFKAGETICVLKGTTPGPKQYSSVQISADQHIELESDLLYMNHSCDPNVEVDVSGPQSEWHVQALKKIDVGDVMTFAYFTTEWDMQQPFDCNCGSARCLGRISGAQHMSESVLSQYPINKHIQELKQQQREAAQ